LYRVISGEYRIGVETFDIKHLGVHQLAHLRGFLREAGLVGVGMNEYAGPVGAMGSVAVGPGRIRRLCGMLVGIVTADRRLSGSGLKVGPHPGGPAARAGS